MVLAVLNNVNSKNSEPESTNWKQKIGACAQHNHNNHNHHNHSNRQHAGASTGQGFLPAPSPSKHRSAWQLPMTTNIGSKSSFTVTHMGGIITTLVASVSSRVQSTVMQQLDPINKQVVKTAVRTTPKSISGTIAQLTLALKTSPTKRKVADGVGVM